MKSDHGDGGLPGHLTSDSELAGLGFLPLVPEAQGAVQLADGAGMDWNTVGEVPDAPGHYLFTVEDGASTSVVYVGLTSHLSMVTRGILPRVGARGGQRYGRPQHAGATRKRVNIELAAQLGPGRSVRHWVRPMTAGATAADTKRLLHDGEERLILKWRLREVGWNRG